MHDLTEIIQGWQRQGSPTGELARLWHRAAISQQRGEPHTEARTGAIRELERLAYGKYGTSGDSGADETEKTVLLPIVTNSSVSDPNKRIPQLPPFLVYRHVQSSLIVALHAACVAAVQQFERLPDALFLSSSKEADLMKEALAFNGQAYTGNIYIATSLRHIEAVPVFNETLLPDVLAEYFGGVIAPDTIIGIFE